jgi:hypothetical protein
VNRRIALLALVAGFMVRSSGAVGALSLWSGRRPGAAGLVGLGLAFLLGSLTVFALLLWLTPVASPCRVGVVHSAPDATVKEDHHC